MNNSNNNHSFPAQKDNPETGAQLAVAILQERGLLMNARMAALQKLEALAVKQQQIRSDPVWNPAWSIGTNQDSVASLLNQINQKRENNKLAATVRKSPPIPSQSAPSLQRKQPLQDGAKRRKRKLPIVGNKEKPKADSSKTKKTWKPPNDAESKKKWEENFELLVEYKIKHNTTQVTQTKNLSLHLWARKQRLMRHRLTTRQDKLLDSIGFDWSTADLQENRREEWIKMYRQLVDYKNIKGNTHVPTQPKQFAALGFWADRQRKIGKRGLERWRVQLLDDIEFAWDSKGKDNWMKMYQALLEFKAKHGTTFVSRTVDAKLAGWCRFQRNQCKDQWRIDLLNDIDFHWAQKSDQNKAVWMKMYNDMVKYKNQHGTTCVPLNWKENRRLGVWVRNQRVSCTEQWRIDLLNKVGFVWSVYTNRKDKKDPPSGVVSDVKAPPPSEVSNAKAPPPREVSNTKISPPGGVSNEKVPPPSESSNTKVPLPSNVSNEKVPSNGEDTEKEIVI